MLPLCLQFIASRYVIITVIPCWARVHVPKTPCVLYQRYQIPETLDALLHNAQTGVAITIRCYTGRSQRFAIIFCCEKPTIDKLQISNKTILFTRWFQTFSRTSWLIFGVEFSKFESKNTFFYYCLDSSKLLFERIHR